MKKWFPDTRFGTWGCTLAGTLLSLSLGGVALQASADGMDYSCAANPCAADGPSSAVKRPEGYVPGYSEEEMNDPELLARGEALFNDPSLSTNGMSCASCHGAPETLRGVATRYPAWDRGLLDLPGRIQRCRVQHQQQPAWAPEAEPLLALTALVAQQSRGLLLQPPQRHLARVHQHPRARLHQRMHGHAGRAVRGRIVHAQAGVADALDRQRVAAQIGVLVAVVQAGAVVQLLEHAGHAGRREARAGHQLQADAVRLAGAHNPLAAPRQLQAAHAPIRLFGFTLQRHRMAHRQTGFLRELMDRRRLQHHATPLGARRLGVNAGDVVALRQQFGKGGHRKVRCSHKCEP